MRKIRTFLLPVLALLALEWAIFLIYKAPLERTMGIVQKIFYFHIGLGIGSFLAFGLNFVSSVAFLLKGDLRWDRRAAASAEIGLVFATLVLATGCLWARPSWGVWWSWDPRLTTMLILWIIYASYFAFRRAIAAESLKARLSAVIGVIGFVDVPIVYGSIYWWQRGLHPKLEAVTEPSMRMVEIVSLVALLLFLAALVVLRWTLEELKHRLYVLEERERFE